MSDPKKKSLALLVMGAPKASADEERESPPSGEGDPHRAGLESAVEGLAQAFGCRVVDMDAAVEALKSAVELARCDDEE